MFSIGAYIKGHWTSPRGRALARRRLARARNPFRPALELLEGRALPSAAPMSLVVPLAPTVTVRPADAGAPAAVTITIPYFVVTPASQPVVVERVFQETFLLEPTAQSSPVAALAPSAFSGLAPTGQIGALTAPASAALTAIPPVGAANPATAAASPTTTAAFTGTSQTTGFGVLPASQAATPAPAASSFAAPETTPTAVQNSPAATTSSATPLTSIGYFLGSDGTTEEDMDFERMMPPANTNPAPANTPPADLEPDRPTDGGAALRSEDADATAESVWVADEATEGDSVLTSDRSIAMAALSAGIGVFSVVVVSEDDTSRQRRPRRARQR